MSRSASRGARSSLAQTSGSTGDRVTNVWYQPWWDASERASWSLNAHARSGRPRLAPRSDPHEPLLRRRPSEEAYLSPEARRLDRFLYLNERGDPTDWTAGTWTG